MDHLAPLRSPALPPIPDPHMPNKAQRAQGHFAAVSHKLPRGFQTIVWCLHLPLRLNHFAIRPTLPAPQGHSLASSWSPLSSPIIIMYASTLGSSCQPISSRSSTHKLDLIDAGHSYEGVHLLLTLDAQALHVAGSVALPAKHAASAHTEQRRAAATTIPDS